MADKQHKEKWVTLEAPIYYAQVFEKNRDMGNMHKKHDGITKVTLVLTDEQVDMLKSMGVRESSMGHDTFKKADFAGDGWTFVAKRPWKHKKFKDKDGNRTVTVMGAPLVFDYHAAVERWKEAGGTGRLTDEQMVPWTMEDGLIGNGTKAKVKISIYNGVDEDGIPITIVTLLSIGIMELVPYEAKAQSDDPWF